MSDNYDEIDSTEQKAASHRRDADTDESAHRPMNDRARTPVTDEELARIRKMSLSYVRVDGGERVHFAELLARTGLRVSEVNHITDLPNVERCWNVAALILIMTETGLFSSTLSRLPAQNVSLKNRTIRVPPDERLHRSNPRVYGISEQAAKAVRQCRQQQSTKEADNDPDEWFLSGSTPSTSRGIFRLLETVVEDAGIDRRVTPITFRKTLDHHNLNDPSAP